MIVLWRFDGQFNNNVCVNLVHAHIYRLHYCNVKT